MFAAINLNEEMNPAGFFVFAGILILLALGTLVSGLHPRWRATATWRGSIARSFFGTVTFSVGALIMAIAMVVRGVSGRRGSLTGIVLWLSVGGAVVLLLGPVCDSFRRVTRR